MRLLYLHNAPVPSTAANAVQVASMCSAFEAAGMPTVLVRPSGPGGSIEEIVSQYDLATGFAVRSVFMPKIPAREILYAASAILRYGSKGDVVYTRSVSVATVAGVLGLPFVLEMHIPASGMRSRLTRRLGRVIASPRFVKMVTISASLRDDYERHFPLLRGRIIVAHDGAAPAPDAIKPVPLYGEFRVGYIGHLYPGKGMEIIAPLAKLCPEATFHIVGGTPADLDIWRGRLSSSSNVVFHGHVPHRQAKAYLAGMHVVLAPYMRVVRGVGGGANLADWMSPLKMFEYMAQGKAIIASDLPVLREVLRHGENALLCDPDDPAAWAEALTGLAGQRQRLAELGECAQSDFLNSYSWDQRARSILKNIMNVNL